MKEKHGQYIKIYWDCDLPTFEYVKGHVSMDEAKKAWEFFYGQYMGEVIESIEHKWARWIPCKTSDYDLLLCTYEEKSKGCFAVTELKIKS